MNTLEEVIKAFEYTYENDPIAWTYGVDALHYLKEYRAEMDNIRIFHDDHIAMKNELSDIKSSNNPALTWDELKQMEGKPVWVEVDGKWWGRFWAFVGAGNDSYIDLFQKGQEYPEDLWKCNMGKT